MTYPNSTPTLLDDDDLPTGAPRTRVRVAQNRYTDLFARAQCFAHAASRDIEDMDDEDLVPLLMEPEFLADCSGLERELIARLAGRMQHEERMEAERSASTGDWREHRGLAGLRGASERHPETA